ncbi:MAG TPA: hypothetical protein VK867_09825 [Candidatus Limnocylindrales bacterium]|nr:hypothetical protein [Candidatus Limnocylindrales bacterium]
MSTRTRGWVIVPERRAVHVWLERPTSVIDGYEIVDRAEDFLTDADVIVLDGPGWSTPRTWKTARLLREHASGHGVETLIESPMLQIDEHARSDATVTYP